MAPRHGVGRDRPGEETGASENEKSHGTKVVDGPEMGNHLCVQEGALSISRCRESPS